MKTLNEDVKLTKYSHGAGCGCKISPVVLNRILKHVETNDDFPGLLVGNNKRDDAAVMEIGNGKAVISTTDFFMPIVDDPYDFGRISSANAISDIYAMGGKPIMAISVLGWPVDKLSPEIAGLVISGSCAVCKEAGIPLAGGHSIDCPEPVFGLAVTGIIDKCNVKTNSGAKEDDLLYLTKPLGIGILTTASKKGIIKDDELSVVVKIMTTLNQIGEKLSVLPGINAITDVTGFGLLGHLLEMAEGSKLTAEINFNDIPFINGLDEYLELGCVPGGTNRNWQSYNHKISDISLHTRNLLCDPQTSGGLLIAVEPKFNDDFLNLVKKEGINSIAGKPIGKMKRQEDLIIKIL